PLDVAARLAVVGEAGELIDDRTSLISEGAEESRGSGEFRRLPSDGGAIDVGEDGRPGGHDVARSTSGRQGWPGWAESGALAVELGDEFVLGRSERVVDRLQSFLDAFHGVGEVSPPLIPLVEEVTQCAVHVGRAVDVGGVTRVTAKPR